MSAKVVIGKAADGSDILGEPIAFEPRAIEPWCEYTLSDGRILRARTIITGVVRADQLNSMGEPNYVVMSQLIVTSMASKPEN